VTDELICFIFFNPVVVKATITGTVTDKVKNRLEQLDDFEEVRTILLRSKYVHWFGSFIIMSQAEEFCLSKFFVCPLQTSSVLHHMSSEAFGVDNTSKRSLSSVDSLKRHTVISHLFLQISGIPNE
jgi:hypothetical protein